MSIFGIQSTITNQIKSYLTTQTTYAAYRWQWNQGEELGIEELPSILVFSKSSVPTDGDREQYQDGSHSQTLYLVFRLFLPKPFSTTLEALSDNLFADVITTLTNSCRGLVRQIGNPSMTYMFADSTQVQTADLEIPIIFMTTT